MTGSPVKLLHLQALNPVYTLCPFPCHLSSNKVAGPFLQLWWNSCSGAVPSSQPTGKRLHAGLTHHHPWHTYDPLCHSKSPTPSASPWSTIHYNISGPYTSTTYSSWKNSRPYRHKCCPHQLEEEAEEQTQAQPTSVGRADSIGTRKAIQARRTRGHAAFQHPNPHKPHLRQPDWT